MLKFSSSLTIYFITNNKEEITKKFLELSISNTSKENPILEPENSKNLRNSEVTIQSSDPLSKYI